MSLFFRAVDTLSHSIIVGISCFPLKRDSTLRERVVVNNADVLGTMVQMMPESVCLLRVGDCLVESLQRHYLG